MKEPGDGRADAAEEGKNRPYFNSESRIHDGLVVEQHNRIHNASTDNGCRGGSAFLTCLSFIP